MNVLRWILSHLFLVMVIIVLFYGWLIREDLANWYSGGGGQSVELEASNEVAPMPAQGRQGSVGARHEEARAARGHQDERPAAAVEPPVPERASVQPTEPARAEPPQGVTLQQARSAFWKGDHEQAIELYRALIAQGGATADIHGELGNILGWVGRMDEALDALEQAAEGLIAEQRFAEVMALLPAIHSHRPQLAEALHQRLLEARRKVFD